MCDFFFFQFVMYGFGVTLFNSMHVFLSQKQYTFISLRVVVIVPKSL